jgi:hypothetical protein
VVPFSLKKRNFIPLAPQPDESDIVVMTRYHTALKRQTTYKKRVTWFNNTANENISKLAFVEYVGELTESETPHGNAKRETAPYKRTHPEIMEKAAEQLKTKKPRQVYKDMVLENEAAAPKHIPQLRHLKFQEEQKDKMYAGNNIADEIDNLDHMLETHEFVQKIQKSKGPTGTDPINYSVLYSENQMKDFEMFVKNTNNPRVGIDRTFNLGCFFVTSIVYKNTRVVRRETNDHPIFLEPILLHTSDGFFFDLLEPWDVRELYIRKTADLPMQLCVDTLPRFVAIGFYFLSETLI